MIEGVSTTLSTSNLALNVKTGAAKFYGESGEITNIRNLTATSTRIKSFTTTQIVVTDDIGTYPISADVTVYSGTSGNYKVSTLNAAMDAYKNKKVVSLYYDKDP